MNRVTTDSSNWWPAKPLVLGTRIYHWTCWNATVSDMLFTPGMLQLILWDSNNQREFVLKDSLWPGPPPATKAGDELVVFGIGERVMQNNQYSFVGLVDHRAGQLAHVNGWRSSIPWLRADSYFGVRSKKEGRNLLMTYYSAVWEVLYRTAGEVGHALVSKAEESARHNLKGWSFERIAS